MNTPALKAALDTILKVEKFPTTKTGFQRHVPAGMHGAEWNGVDGYSAIPHVMTGRWTKAEVQAYRDSLDAAPVQQPDPPAPPVADPVPSPPAPVDVPPVPDPVPPVDVPVTPPVVTPDPAPAPTIDDVDVSLIHDWRVIGDAVNTVWQAVKLGSQCPGKPYSLQLSDSTGVERYEVRADEHCSNDGKGTDKRRSELSGLVTRDQGLIAFGYDLYVEEASFSDPCQYVMGQMHKGKAANGITGDHPPLAFRIVQGGFPSLTVCGSDVYPLTSAAVAAAKSIEAWKGKERFPFGRWVPIKIAAMQGGDDPWAELWMDGVCVVHYKGKIGYKNPEAPPYWKRGIYNAQGNLTKQTCVAYYRNVRAG